MLKNNGQESVNPDGFDVVQKAKHYNVHPSGIECINIIRGLNYDMGAAFKYVFRREGKEEIRSLKSALYYLEDQYKYGHQMVLDWHCVQLIAQVADADTNPVAAGFYRAFQDYVRFQTQTQEKVMKEKILQLIAQGEVNGK